MQIKSEVVKSEYNTEEASEYLAKHLWSIKPGTLIKYRCLGKGPKYEKRRHLVIYLKDELDRYIQKRLHDRFSPE